MNWPPVLDLFGLIPLKDFIIQIIAQLQCKHMSLKLEDSKEGGSAGWTESGVSTVSKTRTIHEGLQQKRAALPAPLFVQILAIQNMQYVIIVV